MSECRSCGAEILWVESATTGKPMPLDATSEKRIVITNTGSPQAAVVDTYVSHFVTCPNAEQHRKTR